MTPILALASFPVAMMLQSDPAEPYFYTGVGPDYWASLELDQEEKEAKAFADHTAAGTRCPLYNFSDLSWELDQVGWERYTKQVLSVVDEDDERHQRANRAFKMRMSWLSDREESALEYAQNGGKFGNGPLSQSLSGGTAHAQLQNFCSHMANSPANILVEIRE